MQWRVELFGGPRLIAPNGEVFSQFATQKSAGLLAYLALTLPRSHLREVLAEQFWPDKDLSLSRNSLSAALSSLRPLLGNALKTGRLRVGLDPTCVTTDLADLEAALAAGDINRAKRLSALEFLPGFYDDGVVLERERLAARL
jgi:DNA-binding SARP family transcriptional activator